jgi:hypothetical protein
VRNPKYDIADFPPFGELFEASSEVAQDETTEQVFSRKDRKAYRAEVLGKRTEAQRTITEPEASTLGQKSKARSKAHRS